MTGIKSVTTFMVEIRKAGRAYLLKILALRARL